MGDYGGRSSDKGIQSKAELRSGRILQFCKQMYMQKKNQRIHILEQNHSRKGKSN